MEEGKPRKKRTRWDMGNGVYVNKKTGEFYMVRKRKEASSEQSSASSGTIQQRMEQRLGIPNDYHSDSPILFSSDKEVSQNTPDQEVEVTVLAEEVRNWGKTVVMARKTNTLPTS